MSFYNFEENQNPAAEDEHYMRLALNEAKKAYDADEIPIGAIVVCKGKIIGKGHNLTEQLNDVTAHAEMQAFTAAAQTLGGKYLKRGFTKVNQNILHPKTLLKGGVLSVECGALMTLFFQNKRKQS